MAIDDWILSRIALAKDRPDTSLVLGRSISGVISWNMNDTCNYRCSYCTQRTMADRTGTLDRNQLDRILSSFAKLPGIWEFKLSGGEPFRQPGLIEIVEGLVKQGHCLSIQTNFSASRELVEAFLQATKGSLHLFSASLHLEYDTAESFVERYSWIQPYESLGVRFHVTCVAVPSRLIQIRDQIAPLFRKHGIVFKIQPEKVSGYVREYSPSEQEILLMMGGHNQTGKIANNFQGRLCHAGFRYLVVKSNGKAYRCYPAARLGGRFAECGSLDDGLDLLEGPKICPYTYCNCTVPIQRGMIEGYRPPITELESGHEWNEEGE